MNNRPRLRVLAVTAGLLTACTSAGAREAALTTTTTTSTTTTTTTSTTIPPTSTTIRPTTTTSQSTTTTVPRTTTTTSAASTTTTTVADEIGDLAELDAAVTTLMDRNDAVSVSVVHDHRLVFGRASGSGAHRAVTTDTPLVLASVSKLVTALTVARLAEAGEIDLDGPVPWDLMNIGHDPAWDTVTVRELLAHTSGMPKAQDSWINHTYSCAFPLTIAMQAPPGPGRGRWVYSNGNYCALGLLIEAITGEPRDAVADALVFEPIDVDGPHLTTTGLLTGDGPYVEGVARLEPLGGAGTWMASSDDIAMMLESVTEADLDALIWPGIITDQYGWGHTGTVDGAKACAWVMQGGRTVVVAIVAGNSPKTGGKVCDLLIPALAADLGIWNDRPFRSPD